MKKIKLKKLDQNVFYEKLSSGLKVYLIPYTKKNNYSASLFTNYGSINNDFIPIGEKELTSFPAGIAHFLEHKMFEMENGLDPFSFYAKTGTNANASTSFKVTNYIIWGNNNISENIKYLLEYVYSPYFTDLNVEKEKGIIIEEIQMYNDLPEWVLNDKVKENLFVNHSIRIPIAGSVSSVSKITKEDLYKCYNTFYQPSNMSLIVAGKFDQEEVMKDIKAQMKNKQFNQRPITNKDYNEPQKVFKTYEKIKMNVEMPKLGYAFKINVSHIKLNPFIRDLYFQMFNTLLFGNASLFKEDVRQKDLAVSFYTSINDVDNYKTLEFFAKTKKAQEFIERIDQELKNISILEKDFNRIKKVWIAAEVAIVDNYELNLDNISDDIQKYGDLIPNKIDIIKSLNKKQLDEMINSLNFNNRTTVIIDR